METRSQAQRKKVGAKRTCSELDPDINLLGPSTSNLTPQCLAQLEQKASQNVRRSKLDLTAEEQESLTQRGAVPLAELGAHVPGHTDFFSALQTTVTNFRNTFDPLTDEEDITMAEITQQTCTALEVPVYRQSSVACSPRSVRKNPPHVLRNITRQLGALDSTTPTVLESASCESPLPSPFPLDLLDDIMSTGARIVDSFNAVAQNQDEVVDPIPFKSFDYGALIALASLVEAHIESELDRRDESSAD